MARKVLLAGDFRGYTLIMNEPHPAKLQYFGDGGTQGFVNMTTPIVFISLLYTYE